MGKKVDKRQFDQADFDEFTHRLQQETDLLQAWCRDGLVAEYEKESGFELEAWLLNHDYRPATNNLSFLDVLNDEHFVSEAAQSCIEMNLPSDTLHNHAFDRHHDRFNHLINTCRTQAEKAHQRLIMIGTLPTAQPVDFTDLTLTNEHRYHAINERLAALREHAISPIALRGKDALALAIDSFSMVGSISSFQIHFRMGAARAARFYNASLALSALTVAISGNSPFLFGCDLWAESRIPFYEQILLTKHTMDLLPRVTFGSRYITKSLVELFVENRQYAPLLPQVMDDPIEKMSHLKLHNGNIYRWNRPVLDFDQHDRPHFRIEHRPLPAGPTVIDMLANAAFYFGLTHFYGTSDQPIEHDIPFSVARDNFYQAAKNGLLAEVTWSHQKKILAHDLILTQLLPKAKEGLKQLDLDSAHISYYLSVIEERVRKKQTGSEWQRQFFNKNGHDFTGLTEAYLELQIKGNPVHDWPTE